VPPKIQTGRTQTTSVAETEAFGRSLAQSLVEGDILLLEGPLGAGKTALVRGTIRGIDESAAELVTSQSYVIAAEYPTTPRVKHLDLYRVESQAEVAALGVEELLYGGGIVFVEWPAELEPFVEDDDEVIHFRLTRTGHVESWRRIEWASCSPRLAEAAFKAAGEVD